MAFAVVKSHITDRERTETEIIEDVCNEVGAIAYLRKVIFVDRLPKTRSGKILRKTMRALVNGEAYTIPSTIDDPAILDEINKSVTEQTNA